MKTLSNRHIAFIDEYMTNGRNATAAYKIVYPKANQRCAEVKGSLLVNKVEVKKEIERREAELREKNKVTLEFLTEKLIAIANSASEFAPGASVSALKLLAQMHGLDQHSPQQAKQDNQIQIKIITSGNTSNGNIQ
jgi:phage terminase small subunit